MYFILFKGHLNLSTSLIDRDFLQGITFLNKSCICFSVFSRWTYVIKPRFSLSQSIRDPKIWDPVVCGSEIPIGASKFDRVAVLKDSKNSTFAHHKSTNAFQQCSRSHDGIIFLEELGNPFATQNEFIV